MGCAASRLIKVERVKRVCDASDPDPGWVWASGEDEAGAGESGGVRKPVVLWPIGTEGLLLEPEPGFVAESTGRGSKTDPGPKNWTHAPSRTSLDEKKSFKAWLCPGCVGVGDCGAEIAGEVGDVSNGRGPVGLAGLAIALFRPDAAGVELVPAVF